MNQAVSEPPIAPQLPLDVEGIAVASASLYNLFNGKRIPCSDGGVIFGRLHLPEYQRPYRWSEEQLKRLLDDLRSFVDRACRRLTYKPSEFPRTCSETWKEPAARPGLARLCRQQTWQIHRHGAGRPPPSQSCPFNSLAPLGPYFGLRPSSGSRFGFRSRTVIELTPILLITTP
ncbi:DUF262 domain-containing protein [Pseudomonas abieticivorans]|uniref:DUF262 domain-containing protein n=1 Tax=Pseudomonas abieticivorans TaxID=2931382 RepID=UPI0020BD557C|nr:DUF262 domain-containing protein [Pseudomonas sp. PIA16]